MRFLSILLSFCFSSLFAERVIRLSLPDYLREVRLNHQAIKVQRHRPRIALAGYHEVRDNANATQLTSEYSRDQVSNINVFSPSLSSYRATDKFNINVGKPFIQSGTRFDLKYTYTHGNIETGGFPNPQTGETLFGGGDEYTHRLDFTIRQSLLRDGPFGLAGKKKLDVAKEQVRLARSAFNQTLEQFLFKAYQAYLRHQLLERLLALSKETLRDSERILAKNKNKVRQGTADITSVYDAEILTIGNREDIRQSESDLAIVEEDILYFMGRMKPSSKEDLLRFEFLTPLGEDAPPIDTKRVYSNAYLYHKSIEQAKIDKKMKKINLDIAKTSLMPKLDFEFRITAKESSLNQNIPANDFFQIRQNPDFFIGLKMELPLEIRAFKTVVERAKWEYRQTQDSLVQVKKEIEMELDRLIREMDHIKTTVRENDRALEIMKKNITQYRKQYENGKIDLQQYILVFDQRRLRQRAYLDSLFRYKTTEAELAIAQGIFLKEHRIKDLNIRARVR